MARQNSASQMRKVRRARPTVAVCAVALLAYAVVGPVSAAYGSSLTGSTFEIDTNANLTVDGAGTDWLLGSAMRAGVTVVPDAPSGGGDDSFTQGTHEDTAVPTVATGSIPPNKSDLKHFGVFTEQTGSALFLNVFWTRVQDPSGTTNMDFEFNQSATTKNDPSGSTQIIPVRTTGDLLLTYDLSNGGSVATLSKRFWDGSSWGPATALTGTQALGSINSSAIAAAASGGLGSLSPRTFGEASVDLAALLPVDQGCLTYGSAYLKSRSSDSFNSELKDFIAPQSVSISNCGTVKVHKVDANGPLAGAGFTLYKDAAPIGVSRGAGDTVVAGTCTTNGSGDCSITDVKKGDYWLVETTVPAGHDAAADTAVSITAGDQVVALTLDDPIQTGTITVTKNAVPDDAQDFTFSLDGTPFSLDDDPTDATLPATRSFTVPVGSHTVTETAIPAGWTLTGLTCTDPSGGTTTSGATATIALAKGETVACTYTDAFTTLNPALSTQAVSAGGGAWNDNASLTGDGTHPVTGTVEFFACAAAAVATPCTSGGAVVGTSAPVVHGSGTAYSAATTAPYTPSAAGWTCFRAVFTSTSAFYSDSTHTNATTECFLKQAQDLTVSKTASAAYGRLYHWTIDKSVDAASVSIPQGGTATSAYTVTVGNTHQDSAWTVTGNVTVTNPNPVAFTGVTITDAINNGAGSCAVTGGTNATVPAGGTLVLPYSCTYSTAPSPAAGTNTATAGWDAASYFTPGSSAQGTANVDFAAVTPSVSDEVVTVMDTVQGVLGTLDARTALNPTVYRYTVDHSGVAGTCTSYDNTASYVTNDSVTTGSSAASVSVCVGADLTVATSASGGKARDDLWTLDKQVDQTKVTVAKDGTATFTYQVVVAPAGSVDSAYSLTGIATVTNPNDWEAITATVTVASDVGGGVACTVTGGTGVVVPKGGSLSVPYSCTFSGAPASSGTATATAVWNGTVAHTPGSSATGSAPVAFALGSETHKTVTVVDDKTDPANPVVLGVRDVADGAHTYTYSVTKAGVDGECTDYTNTASLTETGQSASRTVTVCVGLDLVVSKTALATDHRTFLWGITKDVDKTTQSIAPDGTATFNYTVTATPSGITRDGWSVSGQIKVTNPNHWESVKADITDVVDSGGGASCTVGGGAGVTIAAGATVSLDYTCSFTSQPADGVNTATAAWDSELAATTHGSATGTADVVFVPASKTNETITVVDDKTDPAHPVTLGTATYGDGPQTFTYSVDKQGVSGACTDYTNTATISETEQSASKTVTVCVGQALGVSAQAAGSFDRTYLWSIDKVVDQTTRAAAAGATATFTYTVRAVPGAVADSGYALSGTVTVTNPNAWEDVASDVTVLTDLGGGAACVVTDGVGRAVPAAGELVLPFTCTFTGVPATTGLVTASATWDAALAFTSVATASATTLTDLVLAGETDKVLNVVDDKTDPGHPVALGTATWGADPTVFTYAVTKTAAAGVCTTYTNIATLVDTEQSDTVDAILCGQATGGGGGGGTVTPPVVTPPAAGGGGLAFTGDMTGVLSRWALGLFLAGGALVLLGRRRSHA